MKIEQHFPNQTGERKISFNILNRATVKLPLSSFSQIYLDIISI